VWDRGLDLGATRSDIDEAIGIGPSRGSMEK
jgi:hypothetical protein